MSQDFLVVLENDRDRSRKPPIDHHNSETNGRRVATARTFFIFYSSRSTRNAYVPQSPFLNSAFTIHARVRCDTGCPCYQNTYTIYLNEFKYKEFPRVSFSARATRRCAREFLAQKVREGCSYGLNVIDPGSHEKRLCPDLNSRGWRVVRLENHSNNNYGFYRLPNHPRPSSREAVSNGFSLTVTLMNDSGKDVRTDEYYRGCKLIVRARALSRFTGLYVAGISAEGLWGESNVSLAPRAAFEALGTSGIREAAHTALAPQLDMTATKSLQQKFDSVHRQL